MTCLFCRVLRLKIPNPQSQIGPVARNISRNTRRQRQRDTEQAERKDGFWARRPGWMQHLICLLVLLVVSVGFFAPLHFSGKSLVGGDTVNWRAMAEAMIEYTSETGEQALWAPNAFAGMPGYMISYADQVPQIDDVASFLRDYIWPTSHFIFLLLGAYLLVFFLTRNRLAGVLGACAYGLTTYLPIILTVGHNTKFIALCFAPWLVLAFVYALRRPRLLSSLLFAVALAANLRAGHVQITYYFTFLIGLWWLVEGIGAWREERLARFGKATGWLALGSLLGVLMVAQPYLVSAEYKAYSIRGAAAATEAEPGGLDLDYAMRWSQGPGELLTLAVADAYGGGSRGGVYWGPKPFTEGPHYLGGIVLLLAALGLWGLRRRAVWGLGLAAGMMTLFALGHHFLLLNRLMYNYFPLFDAFRAPETWMSAVAFALAVLAALGLAYVVRRAPSEEAAEQKTRRVQIASGAAVGLAALLWPFGPALLDFEKPGQRQQVEQQLAQRIAQQQPDVPLQSAQVQQFIRQQAAQALAPLEAEREDLFRSDALRTLLFVLLAGGALVFYRRGTLPAWAVQGALVLLVVLDLGGVGRRYLNEDALVVSENISAQIEQYDFDRYILEQRVEAGGPGHFRVASFEFGRSPMTNARPSYFYQSIGGYHGAKLRRYQDYIEHILRDPQTGRISENALDLLNVRYVVAPQPLPGTEVAFRDEATGQLVLRNPDAVPRAFFVGETAVVESARQTWERLRSEDFNPRRTALLPAPIEGFETTPLDTTGAGDTTSVTLESYTPREIVWQVRTDAPRLLVVSEVYYPAGWNATLDGESAPIHRADYLLRAVPVPEGEHRLVMRFEPAGHRIGLWTSAVSTVLVYGGVLVLLGLAFARRRRREEEEPSP